MIHETKILTMAQRKVLPTFIFGIATFAFAQDKINIEGKISTHNNESVPYASVSFIHKTNKVYNDAILTDEKGYYKINLAPGIYNITIEAIDFKKYTFTKEILTNGNIGNIIILPEETIVGSKTKELQEVTITSTKKAYKIELDKKTYDPSQDILSKGGSLQDVLNNVPSVEVDTDGTVSMRGNSNIKFLINGKPSSLLGIGDGAALQSIPANQIERIEVITNPSSKFEASGTAGILNIILKKNKGKGFNGSVEGGLGYFPTARLNTNLSWTKGVWTWFINGGKNYTERKTNRWSRTKFFDILGKTTEYLNQNTDADNKNNSYNTNAGINVNLSEKASFNLSGMLRHRIEDNHDLVTYDYLSSDKVLTHQAERLSLGKTKNTAIQGDIGFDYKFNQQGHNLFTSFSIQQNKGKDDVNIEETNQNIFDNRNIVAQLTENNTIIGKIDYELPIGKASKLEAGYRFDRNKNDYDYGVLQSEDDIIFTPRLDFTSYTIYQETFNAAYIQFQSKINKLSYQLGLRAEHSDIFVSFIDQKRTNIEDKRDYIGYFPSVFLSYDLNGSDSQLLLNYSRRISRPRSSFLIPFSSFRRNDDRNQFFGNLGLNPEYVSSIELGYAIQKKKLTINPTFYFSHTQDETRMITLRESENSDILITKPYNVGSDIHYGLDLNFTADILSWWKIMSNINLFRYESNGEFFDEKLMNKPLSFEGKGFSTRLRLTNTFKIDNTFSLQFQGSFRGGEQTESFSRKPMYVINFGANKTIWKGKGTISFNIQDIFNTRAIHNQSYTSSFEREIYIQYIPRQLMLSFTYHFKQGKVEKIKPKKDINANIKGGDEAM